MSNSRMSNIDAQTLIRIGHKQKSNYIEIRRATIGIEFLWPIVNLT